MSTGHSHGRRGAEFDCEYVERKASKARKQLSGELLEAYLQALERIDELMPHYASQFDTHRIAHGAPHSDADLAEIETIERVINEHVPESCILRAGLLSRMIQEYSSDV